MRTSALIVLSFWNYVNPVRIHYRATIGQLVKRQWRFTVGPIYSDMFHMIVGCISKLFFRRWLIYNRVTNHLLRLIDVNFIKDNSTDPEERTDGSTLFAKYLLLRHNA